MGDAKEREDSNHVLYYLEEALMKLELHENTVSQDKAQAYLERILKTDFK